MLLESVVPWGRLASEYINMFALTPQDMKGRILDIAAGPSSFNAELTGQGKSIISVDPLYAFTAEQILSQFNANAETMLALTEANVDRFRWDEFKNPAQVARIRLRAMNNFLEDFAAGKDVGRYIEGGLPGLPFDGGAFDLALCSHFLFTYSDQFSTEFHLDSIRELARVANEVRVFPIVTQFTGDLSEHLPVVMDRLRELGYAVEVRRVEYEFQIGGNRMLSVRKPA